MFTITKLVAVLFAMTGYVSFTSTVQCAATGMNGLASHKRPTVALLFLTMGNHHRPELWEEFLYDSQHLFSVYAHPKYPGNVTDFLKPHIVQSPSNTEWGHMVLGYHALLDAAYKDSSYNNQIFVFVSDACIPIQPPEVVYHELTTNDTMHTTHYTTIPVDMGSPEARYESHREAFQRVDIQESDFLKHSGWFTLCRHDALSMLRQISRETSVDVPTDSDWDDDAEKHTTKVNPWQIFNELLAGDEHLLAMLNAENRRLYDSRRRPRVRSLMVDRPITHIFWDMERRNKYLDKDMRMSMYQRAVTETVPRRKAIYQLEYRQLEDAMNHPVLYEHVTADLIEKCRREGSLFLRKVDKWTVFDVDVLDAFEV